MADLFQSYKLTKPSPSGPFKETTVAAVSTSAGVADAGKLVVLNSSGQLDPSMGGGGGGGTTLAALTDVLLTSPSDGQFLSFNGTAAKWENKFAALAALSDVLLTSPSDGQFLYFNGTAAKWENKSAAIATLSDVLLTSPSDGQFLYFNSSAAKWENRLIAEADVTGLVSDLASLGASIALKAPLASPALTGTPTAPTATGGTNTTQLATTAFVQTAISGLPPDPQTLAKVAHQWLDSYSAVTGLFTQSQPAFGDISGTITVGQQPTTTVNSVVNDTNVHGSIAAQALTLSWAGLLALNRGGTNADLSGTGGAHQVLKQSTVGAAVTVGQLAFSDISGIASPSQLASAVNTQVGTSYTFADGDRGTLVTFSNASAIAASLPQAGAAGAFLAGWFVYLENKGVGTVTITPVTSNIEGASTLALTTGQGVILFSDGTNYSTSRGMGTGGGGGGSTTLAGLTDVSEVSPADGQALVFDNASSKWKNKAIPATGAGTLASIGNTALQNDPAIQFYAPMDGSANDTKTGTVATNTAVSFVTGQFNQAASYNGTTSNTTYGNIISLGTVDKAFSFWVNFAALPAVGGVFPLIKKGKEAASGTDYYIFLENSSGTIGFTYRTVAGSGRGQRANITPTIGLWYHVAVSVAANASNAQFWVNGTAITPVTVDSSSATFNGPTNTFALRIGSNQDDTTPTFLNGAVDDVAIWNRTLNFTDVQVLYNKGIPVYGTINTFVQAAPPDAPPQTPTTFDDEFNGSALSSIWTLAYRDSAGVTTAQGGTAAVGNGVIAFQSPHLASSGVNKDYWQYIEENLPGTTPWEFTCKFNIFCGQPSSASPNFQYAGMYIRDGASGKILRFNLSYDNTNFWTAGFDFWTTYATFNTGGTSFTIGGKGSEVGWVYQRARFDGANYTLSLSKDGVNFLVLFTVAQGTNIPASTRIGFLCGTNNFTDTNQASIDWFRRTDGGYVPASVGTAPRTPLNFDSFPLSPNANNDEFEATTLNTAWTLVQNTVTSVDYSTTVPGSLYAKFPNTTSNVGYVIGKAFVPGAADFSVTLKGHMFPTASFDSIMLQLSDVNLDLINNPGTNNGHSIDWVFGGSFPIIQLNRWNAGTRTNANTTPPMWSPQVYLHIQRVGGVWTTWYSFDGGASYLQATGLTFGTPTINFVVITLQRYTISATGIKHMSVDFIRFNQIFL